MFKLLLSDFWHVLLFPKDFAMRGNTAQVKKQATEAGKSSFFDQYFLNEELIHFYSEIKNKHNLKLGIYSSGDLFKAAELQEFLNHVFDQNLSSYDIGFEKSNSDAFVHISKQFHTEPSEMIFIDDTPSNLTAAKNVGVETVQYHSNEQIKEELVSLLAISK